MVGVESWTMAAEKVELPRSRQPDRHAWLSGSSASFEALRKVAATKAVARAQDAAAGLLELVGGGGGGGGAAAAAPPMHALDQVPPIQELGSREEPFLSDGARDIVNKQFDAARSCNVETLGHVHAGGYVVNESDAKLLSWAAKPFMHLLVTKTVDGTEDLRAHYPDASLWPMDWIEYDESELPILAAVAGNPRSMLDIIKFEEAYKPIFSACLGDCIMLDDEKSAIAYRKKLQQELPPGSKFPTLYAKQEGTRISSRGAIDGKMPAHLDYVFAARSPKDVDEEEEG